MGLFFWGNFRSWSCMMITAHFCRAGSGCLRPAHSYTKSDRQASWEDSPGAPIDPTWISHGKPYHSLYITGQHIFTIYIYMTWLDLYFLHDHCMYIIYVSYEFTQPMETSTWWCLYNGVGMVLQWPFLSGIATRCCQSPDPKDVQTEKDT